MLNQRPLILVLITLGLLAAAGLAAWGPITQDQAFYNFADQRRWGWIPNAGDVLSNLPFLVIALLGWRQVNRAGLGEGQPFADQRDRNLWRIMIGALMLTSFGSTYFHWHPTPWTLVWDRLPLTLLFMSIFALLISERLSVVWAWRLVPVLLALGAGSVGLWWWSEVAGRSDLRVYVWVQFFPMLAAIVMLLWPGRWRYAPSALWWAVFAAYAVAKGLEVADHQIFSAIGIVSGHTLKHLAGAGAMGVLIWWLPRRRAVASGVAG